MHCAIYSLHSHHTVQLLNDLLYVRVCVTLPCARILVIFRNHGIASFIYLNCILSTLMSESVNPDVAEEFPFRLFGLRKTFMLCHTVCCLDEGESWKDELLALARSKQERTESELLCLRQVFPVILYSRFQQISTNIANDERQLVDCTWHGFMLSAFHSLPPPL